MPSSSLVDLEVEVGVEDEVGVGVGIEVQVEAGVEVGGVGLGAGLTCSHVYYFHGWVVGVEKSRIELTSAKLG